MEDVKKPEATWQEFDSVENILTVHTENDPNSSIYFKGLPEDYDGTATEPAAPTIEYQEKHKEEVVE